MRALVLSGGGSKGAYQDGAVAHLLGTLERRYDILCGVSVGALNAALLAQYPPGQEREAAAHLHRLWEPLTNHDVWRHHRPFARLHGLWRPSFLNSAPLADLVVEQLSPERLRTSGRLLRVGAVSLTDGRYRLWRESDADIVAGVLASSAFPAMLTPVKARGHLWTDGGARNITPLGAAIELGADVVDVVMCSAGGVGDGFDETPNALQVAMRTVEILVDEVMANDIKVCGAYNRLAAEAEHPSDKRHVSVTVMRPKAPLGVDSLEFDPAKSAELYRRGLEDARVTFPGG